MQKALLIKFLAVSFGFFILTGYKAQTQEFKEQEFNLYTQKDGLSNNYVTSVLQDSYGFIWVATRKGLNRFDGNRFLHFYADSNANSLPQDGITKLKWLGREQLGVITPIGLHVIHIPTLQGRNLVIPPGHFKYTYRVNAVTDVAFDKMNNVIIVTRSGLYVFDRNDRLIYRYDHYKMKDVDTVHLAFASKIGSVSNNFVIASIEGLQFYDASKKDLHLINDRDEAFVKQLASEEKRIGILYSSDSTMSLLKQEGREIFFYDTKKSKKYIITLPFQNYSNFNWRSNLFVINDSLLAITSKDKGFYLIRYEKNRDSYTFNPTLYFEKYFCSALFNDRSGHLWIATNKGLFRSRETTGNIQKTIPPEKLNPFNRDLAFRMIARSNGKLYGASSNEGLYIFDEKTLQPLTRLDFSSYGPTANTIHNLCVIHPDTILTGTYGPLVWVNTKNHTHGLVKLPEFNTARDWIAAQYRDTRGNIFICKSSSGEFYIRRSGLGEFELLEYPSNKLFNILVPRYITEDGEGNIWFSGHGISRYNWAKKDFDLLIQDFPRKKTDRKETICPVFDKNGNLYTGLVENGLGIYYPATNTYRQLTRSDGLPDNNIRALYVLNDKLWLGTESGLARYDLLTHKIESFGVAEDLPVDAFTTEQFLFENDQGYLYGAFNNTITRFEPAKLGKANSPPGYFIESVLVAGDKTIYHPAEKIELNYKQNNLVINQAAINFNDPHLQQFAYRFVKEGNEQWQITGTQQSIILSNLFPGKHKLQLKIFTPNNNWPVQIRDLTIVIRPPFWQTTWFMALVGSLLVLSLYLLYRHRVKRIHQRANIDKQLAELEIKGLHAQMNPHFIFNSLNSIKEMILENEKTNASRYLSKFAQLIRTNLEQSRQAFITVNQCVDHLAQYLEMEKIRFSEFSYVIDVDESLKTGDVKMAPMLVQPLVENAIWHGLRTKEGDKMIRIRFHHSGNKLVCEIEDNGIGINQSLKKTQGQPVHRSLGITNIRERISVLNEKYGMACSLEIIDRSEISKGKDTGTIAILRQNIFNHSI